MIVLVANLSLNCLFNFLMADINGDKNPTYISLIQNAKMSELCVEVEFRSEKDDEKLC